MDEISKLKETIGELEAKLKTSESIRRSEKEILIKEIATNASLREHIRVGNTQLLRSLEQSDKLIKMIDEFINFFNRGNG